MKPMPEAVMNQNPTEPGSELYHRVMRRAKSAALMRMWSKTPWMLDVYTESPDSERRREVEGWCLEEFGQESSPIHGIEGLWHISGFNVDGWTWVGFATEEMMARFDREMNQRGPETK